ncbi:hypothetical protein [Methanobrevibacter sp.]|uniref:hypothetical protein n=1 Tax=Methanobrevibacter sp. TaxID=66852 RepID=UPI002E7A2630|nr:hypothetical protein [Methanobrevibacter sp.]MEE0939159.1 hypothetical protein [Methanobrevibacter sp.]
MVGYLFLAIFFIIVVSACCSSDSSTSGNTAKNTYHSRNNSYSRSSYSECPSCGAPGYDGYCEECGYPDINQGWIGENY